MMKLLVTALFILLSAPMPAFAAEKDPAWEKLRDIKRQFQYDFFDLAVEKWPEYRDLLRQYRELELAKIERRDMIYYYWLEHEPHRIVRDWGLERFMNFKWTRRDIAIFNAKLEGFERLNSRVEYIKSKNHWDPNWRKFKAVLDSITHDDDYEKLMASLKAEFVQASVLVNAVPNAPQSAPVFAGNPQMVREAEDPVQAKEIM